MRKQTRPPLAERLAQALEEGLASRRGQMTLRTRTVLIPDPPPQFDRERIRRIRRERNLSQAGLARLLNVSGKTVESREQGLRKPSGPAARFLQHLEAPEAFRWCLDGHGAEAHSPADPAAEGRAVERSA